MSGIRAGQSMSYRRIEDIAAKTRRDLGIEPIGPVHGELMFECLDSLVTLGGTLPVVGAVRSGLFAEAQCQYNKRDKRIEVALSESTFDRLCEGNARALFTLGHEAGHAVLHPRELVSLRELPQALLRGGRGDHQRYFDTEWQANAFSAALLMPAAPLALRVRSGESLTVVGVAAEFGVSYPAAQRRITIIRDHF
jgi:hypothetical protein